MQVMVETRGEILASGDLPRTDREASCALRPVIIPDTYLGGQQLGIVDRPNSALVNGWDNPSKLLWLRVRLTDRAKTEWKRLSMRQELPMTE